MSIAQTGQDVKQENPVSKQILDILYPEPEELTLNNSPLWVTVWPLPEKESVHVPVTKISNVPAAINAWVDSRNIYFGPGLKDRNLGRWKAGSNQHIVGIPGIWNDIDIKGPGHKEENLPTTLKEVISLAYSIPELPPTLIIFSGGGIYAIWLFKEVWILEDESEQNEAQNLLKRFEQTIINQAHSRGWNIDSVADLRHVIRLPGTYNLKDSNNPKQVTILEYHPDRRYNPDDFEPYLAEIETTPIYTTISSDDDFPLADTNKILDGCPWMKHCQDDASSLPEPEWYAMLTIIARCENGREWAHYLSSPYPGYSEPETDKKLKQASERSGPITCEYIQKKLNPSYCQNCTKKVTSPVMLGREGNKDDKQQQKQEQQEEIEILTLSEIAEEVHPENPIIDGLLDEKESLIICGQSGIGKVCLGSPLLLPWEIRL